MFLLTVIHPPWQASEMVRLPGALAIASCALAVLVLGGPTASRWWRGTHLLLRLSDSAAAGGQPAVCEGLVESERTIAGRRGPIRTRLYRRSSGATGQAVVVAHGIHYRGIDEGRLVPFARALAEAGLVVLTPELTDLADYRVTEKGLDEIVDAALHLSSAKEISVRPEVGLIGFSFAGGLVLVAATRPELAHKVAYAVSVGGHHDLERVLEFLVGRRLVAPEGIRKGRPHEYGLAVMVYEHIDHFVPDEDRAALRSAFRSWLQEDREAAYAHASQRVTREGEELFHLLRTEQLSRLRPRLEAIVKEHESELAGLSPRGRLREIPAPVYLLHGANDSVVPSSEAEWAALELGEAPHALLVTPLLDHVRVEGSKAIGDELELVRFMARLL